jgi:two-component system, LytTR family, sensor kinase
MRNYLQKIIRYKLGLELFFFVILFILVAVDGNTPKNSMHVLFIFFRFLILYIAASINRFFIFKPFFLKKKFIYFSILSLINLVVFAIIYYYFKMYYINRFEPEMLPYFNFFSAIALCFISTVLVCGIEFFFSYIKMQDENNRYQLANNQVIIKQLQSQLNPHFLFNSLNNAYGLSLSDSKKTSEYIMSLSQLMRYQLEGSKKDTLLLEDDMEFMHHYQLVEAQRVTRRCQISFQDSIPHDQKKAYVIAPLLFLPFLENAIKHGTATISVSAIHVSFTIEGNLLKFMCKNTKPQNKVAIKSTGTGLTNVKTRLGILYPQKHVLHIEESDNYYLVNLQIELKENESI